MVGRGVEFNKLLRAVMSTSSRVGAYQDVLSPESVFTDEEGEKRYEEYLEAHRKVVEAYEKAHALAVEIHKFKN